MTPNQLYLLLGRRRYSVVTFRYTRDVIVKGDSITRSHQIFVAHPCCDSCTGTYKEAHINATVMPALNEWFKKEFGGSISNTIRCEYLYQEEARAQLDLATNKRTKEKVREDIWLVFEWTPPGSNTGKITRMTFR